MNESIKVVLENNDLVLYYKDSREVVFNSEEYLSSLGDGDSLFKSSLDKFASKGVELPEERALYIYNFILVNNIANYIVDLCHDVKIFKLDFDEKIKSIGNKDIKLVGQLTGYDVLGNVIICLINSEAYLGEIIRIDYSAVQSSYENVTTISHNTREMVEYVPDEMRIIIDKLKLDLIAFKFVNSKKINEQGRFELPIYVDAETLMQKEIYNYQEFLPNWISLAYLDMVKKIKEYFEKYYDNDPQVELWTDSLTLSLISILDPVVKDLPVGLDKSIEKGRETSGKCYFIDKIVLPTPIKQNIAMSLQSKDLFNVVPKLLENK